MSVPAVVASRGAAALGGHGEAGSATAERGEPEPLVVAGLGLDLRTAPLDRLDRAAQELGHGWLAGEFLRAPATEEAALLSTCCRQELVLLLRSPGELERWRSALPGGAAGWTVRMGRELVRHLFRVAAGRESLAVGEREVRAQVRSAGHATQSRHRRRLLADLLAAAAGAADELAPVVPASRSIAALAATRLLELTGPPFPRVVVVGAGAAGRQVAELLGPSARVTLVYRHRAPDERFLRGAGARAVSVDALAEEIAVADAVVTAAKSGSRCLGPADLARDRPVVLVDLGVPRNIDPRVRELPGVRLVDLEELRDLARPDADPAAGPALDARADTAYGRFERAALEPWVDAVHRRAEATRRAELSVARPHLGTLTAEQEAAVDRLTQRLVRRLLAGPVERVRSIPTGEEGDRLRRLALEVLRPDPAGT